MTKVKEVKQQIQAIGGKMKVVLNRTEFPEAIRFGFLEVLAADAVPKVEGQMDFTLTGEQESRVKRLLGRTKKLQMKVIFLGKKNETLAVMRFINPSFTKRKVEVGIDKQSVHESYLFEATDVKLTSR